VNDERQHAFGDAMCRWLEVRQQWEPERLANALKTPNQIKADLWHSGLMLRLLAGGVPLPKPPPLRHSGPWYKLVDEGVDIITERFNGVSELDLSNSIVKTPCLLMEGALWAIEERYRARGAAAWLARYSRSGSQPVEWRVRVEYAGMRSMGVGLTREAQEAYRRRPLGAMGRLMPFELPSGRPATVPYFQPCYEVRLV
jgi:hypothetical protein